PLKLDCPPDTLVGPPELASSLRPTPLTWRLNGLSEISPMEDPVYGACKPEWAIWTPATNDGKLASACGRSSAEKTGIRDNVSVTRSLLETLACTHRLNNWAGVVATDTCPLAYSDMNPNFDQSCPILTSTTGVSTFKYILKMRATGLVTAENSETPDVPTDGWFPKKSNDA